MLNLDTLLLVQVAVTLLTTALLVVAACYAESPPEQRWWAAGNVAVSLGLALSHFPVPALLNNVVGYGVIAFGLALVLRGIQVYADTTLSWRLIGGVTLLALLIPGYFALIEPSLRARLCFSGLYFALLNWLCAAALARQRRWRVTGVALSGFALLGLALLARGVHMALHGDPVDRSSSLVMGLSTLAIPLAQICISFGLVYMVMWRYAERLRRLSTLDALTGALNRAGLELQGKRIVLRAQKARRSLAVMMIDLDHFKHINDSHGHPVGDEVLRQLAQLLKLELRPQDLLARFGGEEFLLLLDGVDRAAALEVAERLRARVAQQPVVLPQVSLRCTASLGVVCSDQHDYDLIKLISVADAAMYDAKRAGRDRVACR